MRLMKLKHLTTVLIGVFVCAAGPALAGKKKETVYHWTDEDGVMHYGDRMPPEHSSTGHVLLNEHGIEVGRVDAEKTEEEKESEAFIKRRN